MKRNKNLQEKYLDAEKLFRKYWEMGEGRGVRMLTEWAILQGMQSSSGKNPTVMGIWKAMWRWASLKENKDVAFQIACSYDHSITLDTWNWVMVNRRIPSAWQFPTQFKKQKFMKEHGWTNE